jgi:hypothetical protein
MKVLLVAAFATAFGGAALGCATVPDASSGGSQAYRVAVASVNGQPTSNRGPTAYPACTIQVADRVASVWLAHPSSSGASPVIMVSQAADLKKGVLVERTWNEAVVHHVTDQELAVGVAVVHVPGRSRRPITVELSFEPVNARTGRDPDQSAGPGTGVRAFATRD